MTTDRKRSYDDGSPDGIVDRYIPEISVWTDTYAFGATSETGVLISDYRFSYQGSEKESELYASVYSTEYRFLDSRLGRWFSTDPITHPHQSPYCSMDNNPVALNDILGLSTRGDNEKPKFEGSNTGNPRPPKTEKKKGKFWAIAGSMAEGAGKLSKGLQQTKGKAMMGASERLLQAERASKAADDLPLGEQEFETSYFDYEKVRIKFGDGNTTLQQAAVPVVATAEADGPLPFADLLATGVLAGKVVEAYVGPVDVVVEVPKFRITQRPKLPFWYVTYTKYNPSNGFTYVGRTSGYSADPTSIVRTRDINHHMNEFGYLPAVLDQSLPSADPFGGYGTRYTDPSYWAIRGREQLLIERYRSTGTSGNRINGISPTNDNRTKYINEALKRFFDY